MESVPVGFEAGASEAEAPEVAGSLPADAVSAVGAAAEVVPESADWSREPQATRDSAASASNMAFTVIAKLQSIAGRHYRKPGRSRRYTRRINSDQLVCLEVALEIAIGIVPAGIFDQIARGAQ